jgi:hypothetical protein
MMNRPSTLRFPKNPGAVAPDYFLVSPELAGRVAKEPAAQGNGHTQLTDEEVARMIAEAAYCRAQRRGFAPGHELDDWLAAEKQILEEWGAAA